MKTRICLVLLSLTVILVLSGCQRSAAKADDQTAASSQQAEKSEPTQYRTARFIHPLTGRVDTKRIPVDADTDSDPAEPATRYTTQRLRNPQTGRVETRRIPVNPDGAKSQPCEPEGDAAAESDQPDTRYTMQRVRNPETGKIETKRVPVKDKSAAAAAETPEKPKTEEPVSASKQDHEFHVSWQENCSVQRAFEATNELLYGTLGLKKVAYKGSSGLQEPVVDSLSAILKARSTTIFFDVTISLLTSDTCTLTIEANSNSQPENVLETHSLFLKEKISEAIAWEPAGAAADEQIPPYPKTLVLNRSVDQIYNAIYDDWMEKEGLRRRDSGGDKYYRVIRCQSASEIKFDFKIHMIDADKAKLDLKIENFVGKEEFPIMLAKLMDVLEKLNAPSQAAVSENPPHTETMLLDDRVSAVYDTIILWAKDKGFSVQKSSGGDAFYKYFRFQTASGIEFHGEIRLVNAGQSKLEIKAYNIADKEEFPAILDSLHEALKTIGESPAADKSADKQTAVPAGSSKNCQAG